MIDNVQRYDIDDDTGTMAPTTNGAYVLYNRFIARETYWKIRIAELEQECEDLDRYSRDVVRAADAEVNLRAKLARAVEALSDIADTSFIDDQGDKESLRRYAVCNRLASEALAALQDVPQVSQTVDDPITDCDKLREERDRLDAIAVKRAKTIAYIYSVLQDFESGDADDPVDRCLAAIRKSDTLHPDTPEQGERGGAE
jgi:DNA-directed RNA polymerase subunit K/omega